MADLSVSPLGDVVTALRAEFAAGTSLDRAWRVAQLQALSRLITEHEEPIFDALRADLGKPACEAMISETGFLKADIAHALRHLRRWMRPRRVGVGIANQPGRARIVPQPKGVVLIIAPWNYPFQLVLSPLVAALAAGNCAVIKPSELAPATTRLLADLLPRYVDARAVRVVTGGVETSTALLDQAFDHVFFTGSTQVGRIVMQAAAKHLTPVTLELGGKSPCLIAPDADLKVAARRIAWGKFLNAGQTCVAPDYVLITPDRADAFVAEMANAVREFFGDDPARSPDYARIIHDRHFNRLAAMCQQGDAVIGGQTDPSTRFIAPTLLRRPDMGAPVMQEEIFGPVLPIVDVPDMDAAIRFVTDRPHPLALYLFSRDRGLQNRVLTRTHAGGVCVNDVVLHLAEHGLPFGGVGASGMGAYHGQCGYEEFSHLKPVLAKPEWGEVPLRYPPYTERKAGWLRRILS